MQEQKGVLPGTCPWHTIQAIVAVLICAIAASGVSAQESDDERKLDVFTGMGVVVSDERQYSFDVGVTGWLSDRWGLGTWNAAMRVPGRHGLAVWFTPVLRYQYPLRRRRTLQLGVGAWHITNTGGTVSPWHSEMLPYFEVLGGVPAASRRFGVLVGVRLMGWVPVVVATGSYTFD